MNNIKMLYSDRTTFLKEMMLKVYVCNRCHDLLMSVNRSNISKLKIKNNNYCCIITGISYK